MDKPALIILLNHSDENSTVFMRSVIDSSDTKIFIVDTQSDMDEFLHPLEIEKDGGKVNIIHAAKNRAPLAGMNYYQKHLQDNAPGAILLDMDQNFSLLDIQTIAEVMENIPDALIVGGREGSSPKKSSTFVISQFSRLTGAKVEDFNSKLRGMPGFLISDLLKTATKKSDVWLEMYVQAAKTQTRIIEVPIKTQHYSKTPLLISFLLNSSKLVYLFIRFSFLSMLTAGIDYTIFSILYFISNSILLSILIARIAAGSFQFFFGKKWVFKSRHSLLGELLKYILLVGVLMLVSYGLIELMVTYFGMNTIISKMVAELSLFIVSFTLQKKIVFAQPSPSKPKPNNPVELKSA